MSRRGAHSITSPSDSPRRPPLHQQYIPAGRGGMGVTVRFVSVLVVVGKHFTVSDHECVPLGSRHEYLALPNAPFRRTPRRVGARHGAAPGSNGPMPGALESSLSLLFFNGHWGAARGRAEPRKPAPRQAREPHFQGAQIADLSRSTTNAAADESKTRAAAVLCCGTPRRT